MARPRSKGQRRAGGGKNIPVGIAHIRSTFNNTIVTISDPQGNVVGQCGHMGFRVVRALPSQLAWHRTTTAVPWNTACVK